MDTTPPVDLAEVDLALRQTRSLLRNLILTYVLAFASVVLKYFDITEWLWGVALIASAITFVVMLVRIQLLENHYSAP